MKTIGLIGGMSWESSLEYYRIINEAVKKRLGGYHSAKSLMYSFDFHEIESLQMQDRWDDATRLMVEAGQRLERGGADFIVIATNTMHLMADDVVAGVNIPLLHIADATAGEVKKQGIQKVALLGTRFTMEKDFYAGRIRDRFGIDVIIPDADDRTIVHDIVYNELVLGTINEVSRRHYIAIIEKLVKSGAEGVILGCTEIGLLIEQQHCSVPIFDTTRLHAEAAVTFALNGA